MIRRFVAAIALAAPHLAGAEPPPACFGAQAPLGVEGAYASEDGMLLVISQKHWQIATPIGDGRYQTQTLHNCELSADETIGIVQNDHSNSRAPGFFSRLEIARDGDALRVRRAVDDAETYASAKTKQGDDQVGWWAFTPLAR